MVIMRLVIRQVAMICGFFFFSMVFTLVVFMWTTPDVCYSKSFLFIKNCFDHFIYCLDLSFMEKQILLFYQSIFRDVLFETINVPNMNAAQPHLLCAFCYLKWLKCLPFLDYTKLFVWWLFPASLNLFKIKPDFFILILIPSACGTWRKSFTSGWWMCPGQLLDHQLQLQREDEKQEKHNSRLLWVLSKLKPA